MTTALDLELQHKRRRHTIAGVIAIVLLTLIAYIPVIADAGFIWDDDSYLTDNPVLRAPDALARIWTPGATPQYYPVVFTSFWLEMQAFGLNPRGYHVVNILLHIATSLLLWLPPALVWGPTSMIRSFELAREVHAVSENAFNIPILRVLALPIAIAALFLKQWWMAAVTGLAIFLIVLFFDFWASIGYLVAITPITGILLEMGARNLRQRRRPAPTAAEPAFA